MLAAMIAAWMQIVSRLAQNKPPIERRRRRKVPWEADGALLCLFFLSISLLSLLAAALAEEPADQETLEVDLKAVLSIGMTWALLSMVAIGVVHHRYLVRAEHFGIPRKPVHLPREVYLGLAACAASLPVVYGVQALIVWGLQLPSAHPTIEQLLSDATFESIASAAAIAIVLAPVFEELAFRVLLQGWLEKLAGPTAWWPIVVSSVAFSAAHTGQGWAPVPLFVFALGIGYLYRQTHSYPAVVAMHMSFNALSLLAAVAASKVA